MVVLSEGKLPNSDVNVILFVLGSRLFSIFSWAVSYQLLIYLYRKGLSEFWYAHKMYWLLNTLFTFSTTIWQVAVVKRNSSFLIVCKVILIILNISLLVLMLKTKARTVEEPRPGIRVTSEGHIFIDPGEKTRRTTSYSNMRDGVSGGAGRLGSGLQNN